jgi:hypothetical protein
VRKFAKNCGKNCGESWRGWGGGKAAVREESEWQQKESEVHTLMFKWPAWKK